MSIDAKNVVITAYGEVVGDHTNEQLQEIVSALRKAQYEAEQRAHLLKSIKELTSAKPAKSVDTKTQAGSVNVKLIADTKSFTEAIDAAISKLKELEQLKALTLEA